MSIGPHGHSCGCIINGYLAVLTVCGQTIAAGLSPTPAQTCPGSKDSIINNKIMCSFVIPNVALQMYSTNLHNIPPFFWCIVDMGMDSDAFPLLSLNNSCIFKLIEQKFPHYICRFVEKHIRIYMYLCLFYSSIYWCVVYFYRHSHSANLCPARLLNRFSLHSLLYWSCIVRTEQM